jgi:hypothetical protein
VAWVGSLLVVNGKVLGVIETTYIASDKAGNIYTGDTSVGRVANWTRPKK